MHTGFCHGVHLGVRKGLGLLLAVSCGAALAEGCPVAYFKAQAMAIHVTQDRVAMTQDWLKQHIPHCSAAQLKTILGNSPMWLGTALTPKIAGLLEAAIEAKSQEDEGAVAKLLAPPTRPNEQALTEVHATQPARRGARDLTKPGSLTAPQPDAVLSQAAAVAAAAATAASIVQGQNKPATPAPATP